MRLIYCPRANAPARECAPARAVLTSLQSNDVGADDCELRLLLVSGESFRLVLSRDASVRDVKQRVISEQPAGALLQTSVRACNDDDRARMN